MQPKRRVYGVSRRGAEGTSIKFCCDFETEERLGDRFDVFHVDIEVGEIERVIDPFLATLAEESQKADWELFLFRVPSQETLTEVIFSEEQRLAVFDKFEAEPPRANAAGSDELRALIERKAVEKALTVEGAVAKLLNRKLVTAR